MYFPLNAVPVKMTLKTATGTFKQLLAEITLQLMICALRCGPSQRDFSILSFVQRWGNVDGWMRSSVFSQTLYSCWSARWDNSLFKQTYAASIRSVSTKQASSGCAAVTHRPFVPSFTMWLHEINVSAPNLWILYWPVITKVLSKWFDVGCNQIK